MIVDDTMLDTPYSEEIGFVRYQCNGKQHLSVKGIDLVTLIWTDVIVILPINFCNYDIKEDNKTTNDHFLDMLIKLKSVDLSLNMLYLIFDMQV